MIALAVLLVGLMTAGVAVGFSERPLSALREFSVSYLILVLAPYAALFLRTRKNILQVFKAVALFGVGAPLILLPLVATLKGWGIGPEARFYPSPVHMGILYGLVAICLLQSHERSWRSVFVPALPLAGVLLIADSHRSVWLATAVAVLLFVLTGRIRPERFWKWGGVAVLVALLVGTALTALHRDPIAYVASRSVAFSNPSADGTAAWRLALWEASIEQGREHLVSGEGFGFYFDAQTSHGRITHTPHSLYVQTFLKIGLAGLLTLVALAAALVAALAVAWRRVRLCGDRQMESVVLTGLIAACAALAYGLVYAFDPYSMVFIGLGLSAALRSCGSASGPRSVEAPCQRTS
jgi:O-antigen ligase